MQRIPLSARVSVDIDSAARAKADVEGVSLSAIVERALAAYLESSGDSSKPDWAIALEGRVSQVEALDQRLTQVEAQVSSDIRGGSRKGKRR